MVKKLLLFFLLAFISSSVFSQKTHTKVEKDSLMIVKDIIASPNPFSVTTKIKFKAAAIFEIEFSVKDLIGNIVFSKKYNTHVGTNVIPFYKDKLDAGIYIYSIKTTTEIISKRIVVK